MVGQEDIPHDGTGPCAVHPLPVPVGRRALQRTVNGEACAFCCYGCCIAYQVKNGKTEEWEAAWLLIRLGVGGFLSMNIMLFSLILDRKSTRLNSSHPSISYAVFCLKKKKKKKRK